MKTSFRWDLFRVQNAGPHKWNHACFLWPTGAYIPWPIFTWLHPSDSSHYDLPSFRFQPHLNPLHRLFCLPERLFPIISFRSSWKTHPHNETVPDRTAQNFSTLSWASISSLPAFFSSLAFFLAQHIFYLFMVCVLSNFLTKLYASESISVCLSNAIYLRSVAEFFLWWVKWQIV